MTDPAPFLKISRTTVRDQAVDKIRTAIVSGYLRPGTRLVEKDLCELIGVGRSSLREALRILEGEKLITAPQHKGPSVAIASPLEVEQIFQVRAALAPLVCRQAASKATAGDVLRLEQAVAQFAQAVERGDLPASAQLADDFYDVLLAIADNQVLADIIHSLRARISFLRAAITAVPGRGAQSLVEMRAMVRAIKRLDPEAAVAACVRHVEATAAAARAGLMPVAPPLRKAGAKQGHAVTRARKAGARPGARNASTV